MLVFTGRELRAIGVIAMRAKQTIPLKTLQTPRSLNVCSVAKTHRGNTAEISHFCSIPIAIAFDRNYDNITRLPLVSLSSSDLREPGVEVCYTSAQSCRDKILAISDHIPENDLDIMVRHG